MTQSIHSRGLITGAIGMALALLLGGSASADEHEKSLLEVHSVTDEAFVNIPLSESPHGPTNAMFISPGPGWGSAGVHRFEKGKTWLRDWVYWYHEFVYVTRGRGKVTISMPPYTSPESKEVKAGDIFVIGPAAKVSLEGLGDEIFEIVWAVPE